MPDVTVSADIDAFLVAANDAAARGELAITSIALVTPGTGVNTALAINVGSAGAFLTFNGAGGTPSSMVGTNITGTAVGLTAGVASAVAVGGISGLGAGVGAFLAAPSGANLATALTTALPATKGGTGLTALGTGVATALGVNTNAGGGFIALADPGADRIVFWDDSAGAFVFLTVGTGLDITNTTLTATGSGSGDVVGPGTSTENAIAIYGDTTGNLLEDTSVTITGGNTINAANVAATNATVTTFLPVANDGAAIGASGTAFSDLFLASGAVINFNAGNLTLTHSAGVLTSNGAYVGTTATLGSTTSLLLGTAGSAVGNIGFRNATSGTITLAPPTGALGTVTLTLPAATDTLVGRATTDTLTNKSIPVTVKITAASYTIGTTSPLELYGGVIYVTSAATITIPAVVAGQSFTVITIGAIAVSVDPNAADLIILDGTTLSDGDKITNLSTAGDIAVFTAYDATGWYAATNGWTDTN
jgi:hypothetical protein